MSKNRKRIISQHDKRISLRCPAAIVSSVLEQDKEDKTYSIRLTLENTGDSSIDNDTVQVASLVIRCTDSEGNSVSFDDNDYLVKTVNFGESGLPSDEEISMMVMLGDFDEIQISDFEVYVSRIRFADGAVLDYLRADFFPVPAKPIPLTKKLNSSELSRAKETFGDSAEFVPEKLSSVVWRCTCSEICEGPVCAMCATERDMLFDYFGTADTVYIPKKERKNKALAVLKDRKKFLLLILCLIVLILATLLTVAIIAKAGKNSPDKPNESTVQSTTTGNNGKDPSVNSFEELALAYANANQFDSALEACSMGNVSEEFYNGIVERAIEHSKQQNDYVKAYEYAQLLPSYSDINTVLSSAYTQCLNEKNYNKAIEFASLLGDSALKLAAVRAITDSLVSQGNYTQAYSTAISHSEPDLAEEIVTNGIEKLTSENNYNDAIALATAAEKADTVLQINKDAAYYYISISDFDGAAKYAAASGEREVLEFLCEKLDDASVKKNLPSYFEYLTTERKRTILSSKISAGRLASVITNDNKVLYGMGQIYTPPTGVTPVSVASGVSHTVILLSNGKLVAFGDNSYGQCNVSNLSNVIMISAGQNHTVALLADGKVVAVGDNRHGQCDLSALSDIVMVSAGDEFTLALDANGTVTAVGNNSNSQCDVSSFKNVVSISAGRIHSVAVTSDGKALSAGSILLGMSAVSDWRELTEISAGSSFTVGMTESGSLIITGSLITGSVGNIIDLEGAVQISTGDGYILALMDDGTVKASGSLAPDVTFINNYISSLS